MKLTTTESNRKSEGKFTAKTTGKHKRTGINPRNNTIHGKIFAETFGAKKQIDKSTEKE